MWSTGKSDWLIISCSSVHIFMQPHSYNFTVCSLATHAPSQHSLNCTTLWGYKLSHSFWLFVTPSLLLTTIFCSNTNLEALVLKHCNPCIVAIDQPHPLARWHLPLHIEPSHIYFFLLHWIHFCHYWGLTFILAPSGILHSSWWKIDTFMCSFLDVVWVFKIVLNVYLFNPSNNNLKVNLIFLGIANTSTATPTSHLVSMTQFMTLPTVK